MTFRAVLIGLLGGLLICSFSYLGAYTWPLGLSLDSHLPVTVFGGLVVVMLAVNPLLYLIRPRLRLRSGELAIILVMCLTSCGLANWTNTFSKVLTMPIQMAESSPTARKYNLMGYLPPQAFPGDGRSDSHTVQSFVSGLGRDNNYIGLGDIPWRGWAGPLSIWMPLITLSGLTMIGLSLVIHRQWATHERLRYPIADFGSSLLAQDDSQVTGKIYHNRMFWIGLGVLFLLSVYNFLAGGYLAKYLVKIPLSFDFAAIQTKYPSLKNANWEGFITSPTIIPIAVAFSYFLASDVGLSLGLSNLLFEAMTLILVPMGITPGSKAYVLGGWDSWMRFGSFTGMMLVLLYTGRRYYGGLIRQSLGFGSGERAEASAVWGLRLAVVSFAGGVAILVSMGLEWTLAVGALGLLLVIYVVVSRMSAEAGQFDIRAAWMPIGVVTNLVGAPMLGPQAFMIIAFFSMIMVNNTQSALMPYLVNGLKIADDQGVKPSRVAPGILSVLVLGVVVSVPVFMWTNYNFGSGNNDGWAGRHLPNLLFTASNRTITELRVSGQLEDYQQYGPLERLMHIQPENRFVFCAVLGLALVGSLSVLRMRFHWWPLHPILMLAFGSWTAAQYCFSFLVGWAIKQAITHLGGGKTYQQVKPLMIGVIAGDLLGSFVPLVVKTFTYITQGAGAQFTR